MQAVVRMCTVNHENIRTRKYSDILLFLQRDTIFAITSVKLETNYFVSLNIIIILYLFH